MSGWTANINSRIQRMERYIERHGLEDDPAYQAKMDALYAERGNIYEAIALHSESEIELGRGGFGT